MKLRHIIQRAGINKPTLVAEVTLSDEQVRSIRTRLLMDLDVVEEHLTRIYWFNGEGGRPCTHPPAPVHLGVIDTFRGLILIEEPANYVNQKVFVKWAFQKRV